MATEVKDPTKIAYAEEQVLLGAWLMEIGTEYIKYFTPTDFTNDALFKALKGGASAIDIPRMNIGYTFQDLKAFMETYTATFFRQAIERAFNKRLSIIATSKIITRKDLKSLQHELEMINTFGNVPNEERDGLERLKAEFEFKKNEKVIKYGLPYLDKLTGGIHRKELTTVAARPGVGKSSFALQVASLAGKFDEKVLYFTLEMPYEQQLQRLLVQTNTASAEELANYDLSLEAEDYIKRLESKHNLIFYESVNNLPEICAAIQRQQPYMAVIDQLTQVKIKGEHFKSRLEELQEITSTLKKVSMEENVAIMLLCQINRDAANSEPTLANLKGSGQIEEDSDNVILIHSLEKNDSAKPKTVKEVMLKLEKQRSGATSSYTAMFNPKKYRFYELSND